MSYFLHALQQTIDIEKGPTDGYVNDQADLAGETYMGITRKYWPFWEGWQTIDACMAEGVPLVSVENTLKSAVMRFYRDNYWQRIQGDEIAKEAVYVAYETFDSAVNSDPSDAVKWLQTALNMLNRNQTDYADIQIDGHVGEHTLSALHQFMIRNDQRLLVELQNLIQAKHVIELTLLIPSQERNLRGWMKKRILRNLQGWYE